jgi:protein ImuA
MPDSGSPFFVEALSDARDGAATGFVLAQLDASRRHGPILWVQDPRAVQEGGLPCIQGIDDRDRPILRVSARNATEALWAMEEGLECAASSAVIGEIWGDPKVLDFTATKRLALRSRRSGVPIWLLRPGGAAGLSVAPERWRLSSVASAPHPFDAEAPGPALWRAERFRSRSGRPGLWVAAHDRAAHRLDLAAPLRDRAVGAGAEPGPPIDRSLGRTGT